MMASTPPPPRRIHTPPTPLHGAKYDSYEPYSPRRSTRVAAQRFTKATPSPTFSPSPLKSSAAASTPPSTLRLSKTRTTRLNLSPPSSPNSPTQQVPVASPKASPRRARTSRQSRRSPIPASDSDTDIPPENETQRRTSSKESFGMLNTPAKTPRRGKNTNVSSAARLLFGDNEGLLEPTPRKIRKSFLDPFNILEDEAVAESSKIEIYTDSKERVPNMDHDDSNPFLSKNSSKASTRSKSKRKTPKDAQLDEAVQKEEGMVYVFRGRKVFRKFEDVDSPESQAEDDDNLSDIDIRRKAGTSASKPLLRSSIKPRLLFPSEEQRRAREEADEADEEALTDIEMPKPVADKANAITPTKQRFTHVITPPTTVKTSRVVKEDMHVHFDAEPVKSPDSVTSSQGRTKRSPFDGYLRKKPTPAASRKREGSPTNEVSVSKRTRSTADSSSTAN